MVGGSRSRGSAGPYASARSPMSTCSPGLRGTVPCRTRAAVFDGSSGRAGPVRCAPADARGKDGMQGATCQPPFPGAVERRSGCSSWPVCSTDIPTRSPPASGSAWRWAAPSSASPRSFSSTSPSPYYRRDRPTRDGCAGHGQGPGLGVASSGVSTVIRVRSSSGHCHAIHAMLQPCRQDDLQHSDIGHVPARNRVPGRT